MTTELVLLGTAGAPLPVAGRGGISSALIVNERVFVVDCGRGSPSAFVEAGLEFPKLEAVLLTHLHADHIGDLPGLLLYGWGVRAGARARGVRSDSLARQLGETLAEAGHPNEAVAVLRPLASGDDPTVVQDLGIALSDGGHQDEAVATLEQAVRRFPQDPRGYENLGIVALRRGRPEEARGYLEKALGMNARLPYSWNSLGVALYQLRQPDAALDAWHRACALDPGQYDALFNLGLVAAELGRRDEARQALAAFVATAPRPRFAAEIAKAQARLQGLGG